MPEDGGLSRDLTMGDEWDDGREEEEDEDAFLLSESPVSLSSVAGGEIGSTMGFMGDTE